MALELTNPEQLPTPPNYTQVVAATGSQLVFLAGQVPDDADGNLVGDGDLASQAHQAFANLATALAAMEATPDQVAKVNTYVVHYRSEYLTAISQARQAAFGDHKPAATLIGVEALAQSGYLIEVEAIAVLN